MCLYMYNSDPGAGVQHEQFRIPFNGCLSRTRSLHAVTLVTNTKLLYTLCIEVCMQYDCNGAFRDEMHLQLSVKVFYMYTVVFSINGLSKTPAYRMQHIFYVITQRA